MSLRFLRYARPAVAAAISHRAGDAQARIRAAIAPELRMRTDNEGAATAAWNATGATMSVLGPADVVALATDQILARVPAADANGVSPTQFAWVEFARADLPWLFTPYAPSADDTLMPWLCLVAVPANKAELTQGAHGAVLKLKAEDSAHLPNLARAAEWAHVQEGDARAGDDSVAVGEGLHQQPRRFRSRLLCPTVLRPDTDYLACLVPTFLGGRKAGLGDEIDLSKPELLGPAWIAGQAVELPVYDHWHFTTGASDRFSDLVKELDAYDPSSAAGRTLEAGAPEGPNGPQFANARLVLDAVMRPDVVPAPTPVPTALTTHLTTRLADPSPLAPPVYGGRHVRAAVPFAAQAPAWVRELNLDPTRRTAAGLGAEIVRRHQEEMMAAIWEQAGEIERANQLLRIGQTARAVATVLFQRRVVPDLQNARDGRDLGVVLWLSPMLGHLPVPPGGLTGRAELERSCLPPLATSGAYRKFARPNGPLMRRLRRQRDGVSSTTDILLRLADGAGRRTPPPAPDATTITYAELAALGQAPRPTIGTRFPTGRILIDPTLGGRILQPTATAPESLERARSLAGRLAMPRGGSCRPMGAAGGIEREALFEGLRAAADPAMTIPRRVRARIGVDAATRARIGPTDDALDPIMLAPKLPWAMSRPLMAMARDWMAPSLEARNAPENYIAVLKPNQAFIEGYMAGLNEEIGREMLWRGFPTDQRGTVFDRFWTEARAEWPELHTWGGLLGSHGLAGTVPKMVIAVRGRLLQRFDRAQVFLQKASTTVPQAPLPDLGGAQSTLYPVIETRLPGGVACFGFDLTSEQAMGGNGFGPGWYLVFQEPPTDLRFGPPATAAAGSHVAGAATPAAADTFAESARRPQQRVYIHALTLLGRI